jgi:ferritin-like protein
MGASSTTFHEPYDLLSSATRDMHRAIVSLMEELEALDWYAQRAEVAANGDLKQIVVHNGNEEKEHAAMLLEWIRRHDPVFDRQLRAYLFREGDIVKREEQADAAKEGAPGGASPPLRPSLGSLRETPK